VVAQAGSVAVRPLADRTSLTLHLSAMLTAARSLQAMTKPGLVDVATTLACGGEARVLRGCGRMSSEPRGPTVGLVLGAERLRQDPLFASGTDDLDRDQNRPDDQRLPAI